MPKPTANCNTSAHTPSEMSQAEEPNRSGGMGPLFDLAGNLRDVRARLAPSQKVIHAHCPCFCLCKSGSCLFWMAWSECWA